jgi:hypothetical protein
LRVGFERAAPEGVFEVTALLNGAQAKQEFRGELNLVEEKKKKKNSQPNLITKATEKHTDHVDQYIFFSPVGFSVDSISDLMSSRGIQVKLI